VDLARHGFATWNVEYRRLGSGGGWPATFLDAAAALEPVTSLPGVDRRQVLVLGHSAGGVLALWVAARGDSRRLSRRGESDILPSLAVALAAPTDLPAAVTQKVGYGAIEELLTNAPGDPSQYSPMQMIPLGCPQLVMTGEEDDQVPPGMSIRYAGRAEHAGDEVRLVTIPGAGHFDFLAPESVAWKTVKESLVPVAG
jgi:acetyl esterase/lipase